MKIQMDREARRAVAERASWVTHTTRMPYYVTDLKTTDEGLTMLLFGIEVEIIE